MAAFSGTAAVAPSAASAEEDAVSPDPDHPVVVFEAAGGSSLVEEFAAQGWRVWAGTVCAADSDGRLAEVTDVFASPRSPDRAVIVGVGKAGSAVTRFADNHPERAAAVVLVDAEPEPDDATGWLLCPTLVVSAADATGAIGRFLSALSTPSTACPAALPALTPVLLNDADVMGQLRELGPVHRVNAAGVATSWILTGHEATTSTLADPRLLGEVELTAGFRLQSADPSIVHKGEQDLVTIDAREHARLRRLVGRYLTPARVESLRPRLQHATDALLDVLPADEPVDLLARYARPLPIVVLCELCGVPAADRAYIEEWLVERMRAVPPEAHADVDDYLGSLIARRRRRRTDDLLGWVVEAEGERLSEPDLIAAVRLLMVAGHRAPTTLLANGVAALLRHPEQWQRLVAEPELVPQAVEELLRYVTPFPVGLARHVTAPVEIADSVVPEGDLIAASLVAANHDPCQFADPDRLDVTRRSNPHLAFGHGHHYCLGAALSRVQAQIAIGTLLRRFPGMRLADDPANLHYRQSRVRYLLQLPVILQPPHGG